VSGATAPRNVIMPMISSAIRKTFRIVIDLR
jgi:hypothetical protein